MNIGMWIGAVIDIIALAVMGLAALASEDEAGQAMPVAPIVFYLAACVLVFGLLIVGISAAIHHL